MTWNPFGNAPEERSRATRPEMTPPPASAAVSARRSAVTPPPPRRETIDESERPPARALLIEIRDMVSSLVDRALAEDADQVDAGDPLFKALLDTLTNIETTMQDVAQQIADLTARVDVLATQEIDDEVARGPLTE